MKKTILLLCCLFTAFSIFAQTSATTTAPANLGKQPIPAQVIQQLRAQHAGQSRVPTNIALSCDISDDNYATNNGGTYTNYSWLLNKHWPEIAQNNYNMQYMVQVFDTIIDVFNGYAGSTMNGTTYTVDSIDITYAHTNYTGNLDTIRIILYRPQGILGIQIDTSLNDAIVNVVAWDTIITTTSSLTGFDNFSILTVYPNISSAILGNSGFVIGLEFYGDTVNRFQAVGGFADYCNNTCAAALSVVPYNTGYKLISFDGGGNNISQLVMGDIGVVYDCNANDPSGSSASCELVQLQNTSTIAYLTAELGISVVTSGNQTICQGSTTTITANASGGSGNYTYTWMPGNLSGPSITVTPGSTTTYTVTANDGSSTATATATITTSTNTPPCSNGSCPGPATGTPGFRPDSNNLACIVQNIAYFQNEEFEIPATYAGFTITSVVVDSIVNLPCGISFTMDRVNRTYVGGEVGCITFSGTTTDPVGQYQQEIYVTATIQLVGTLPTALSTLGYNHYLRIKASAGAACPNVTAGPNLTASGTTCSGGTPLSVSTSGNQTICLGTSTTLTATGAGGTGNYTYTWNPGGLSGPSVSVTPSGTTTYTVTVNDGSTTATATATVTTTTATPPCSGAALSVSTSGNQTICLGTSTTLTATGAGGTGNYTYTWMPGSLSGASVSVTPSGTTTYTVTVNDGSTTSTATATVTTSTAVPPCAASCPGAPTGTPGFRPDSNSLACIVQNVAYLQNEEFEIPATYAGFTITSVVVDSIVNLPCGISFTMDRVNRTYVGGEVGCITFSGTTTDPVGQYQQEIYVTATIQLVGTLPTALSTLGYNHYLRIKASAGAACPNVTAGPNLTASGITCSGGTPLSVSTSGNQTICLGTSTTLTATGSGGTGNYTYTWMPGSLSGASVTVTPGSTTTYTVTVNDGSTTSTATATVTTTTAIPPCAGAALSVSTSGNQTICLGTSTTLTATGAGGTGNYTYTWMPGSLSGASVTVTPSGTTTYTVTVNDGSTTSTATATVTTSTAVPPCSNPVTPTCSPNLNITSPGLAPADSNQPCVVSGQYYETTVQFKNFTSIDGNSVGFPGITIGVDSLRIDSIPNLPSGLSFACFPPSCVFGSGENGCIVIYGTTFDPGNSVFTLDFYGTMWTDLLPGPIPVTPSLLSSAGISYRMWLINQGSNCPNTVSLSVNTSGNQTICLGTSTTLTATGAGGTGNYTYTWMPGSLSGASVTVTPGSTTTYTVTVNDGSTTATSTATVTTSTATPPCSGAALSVSTSGNQTICLGTSTTLTATGAGGTGNYTYTWMPGSLSGASVTVTPSGTTTYTVTVNDGSTTSTATATVTTSTATPPCVATPLTVSTSGNQTICQGSSATLTATGAGGSGNYTYTWMPGSLSGASVTVTPGSTTTYTVTVNDGSTTATATAIVTTSTAVPPCTTPLSVSTSNNVTICAGTNTNIVASAAGGTGNYTYNWSNGGSGASLTVAPTATTTYTVTVSDGSSTVTGSIIVTTTTAVPPCSSGSGLSLTTSGNQTICLGTSTLITASASGGSGNYTYNWSNGTAGSSVTVSPTSTTTYSVTVNDGSSSQTKTVTISVTTASPPCAAQPLTVSTSGNATICLGNSTTLTAAAAGGTGNYTYTWNPGGLIGATVSITPGSTTSYTVSVNDGVSTVTKTITVTTSSASPPCSLPPLTITATGGSLCDGGHLTMSSSATGGTGNYTYTWTPTTGLSCYSCPNPTAYPLVSTTYTVIVSDGFGTASDTALVNITNLIVPSVTISSFPDSVCAGTPIDFTATVTGEGNTPMYSWKVNGNSVGGNSPSYASATLQPGDQVWVVLTSSVSCFSINNVPSNTLVAVACAVGIDEPYAGGDFKVYPNPFNNYFDVNFTKQGEHKIEVFNLTGQMLFNTTTRDMNLSVNTDNWLAGYYLIKVDGLKIEKLVLVR